MFSLSIHRVISVLLLSMLVSGFSVSSFSAPEKVAKPTKSSVAKVGKVGKVGKVAKSKPAIEQTVNINTATAEIISSHLKGVGLKKAQAIIEWRKANGKFVSVEQLTEVKGIGEKTMLANKEKIAL